MAAPFVSVLSRNVTPTLSSLVRKFFFLPAELYSQTGVKPPNPSSNNSSTCHLPDSPASLSAWRGGGGFGSIWLILLFPLSKAFLLFKFLTSFQLPIILSSLYYLLFLFFTFFYSVFNSLSFDPLFFRPFFHFSPYLSPFSTLTFPWIFLSSYFLTCTAFFHLLLFLL